MKSITLISYLATFLITAVAVADIFFELIPKQYQMGFYFSLIIFLITGSFSFSYNLIRDLHEKSIKPGPQIRYINESDFYDFFNKKLKRVKKRADITYFNNHPPDDSSSQNTKKYYRDLIRFIKRKDKVMFRRIIRATPQNEKWIKKMLRDYKSVENFSLACYCDGEPEKDSLGILAVQLIDDEKSFIVAAGAQSDTRTPRDVYIKSPEMNEILSKYYDKIWVDCKVIIQKGVIKKSNNKEIQEYIESIKTKSE